jgi:lysophospholipase L1-like esterase
MGDSLTEMWTLPRVNLGKYGQTTTQMLKRFPADIANKNLRSVIILGGTNDVLLSIDPALTITNLSSMADIAISSGIKPVLCEIPPIYARQSMLASQVAELNRMIAALAASKNLQLVDFYDPLNGHPAYFSDGIHMRSRAYLIMDWALAQKVSLFRG